MFDDDHAEDELKRYRKRGPRRTTRILIRELLALGVEGRTALDVGGGVGAVHLALLEAGAREATDVDASAAFLRAAKKEAIRRGLSSRVTHRHGDFVELASQTSAADIVALDKVVCCYEDAQALLALAAERARRILGLVYPRDGWLTRLVNWVFNLKWLRSVDSFRTFVHSRKKVEEVIMARGFQLLHRIPCGFWQVTVFSQPR
jgi:magnesium-protoporphyrin O-methyltransferase